MKKAQANPILCIILAAGVAACSSENVNVQLGAGRIAPQLTVSPDVVIAEDVQHPFVIDSLPEANQFKLILRDNSTGQSHSWASASDFPASDLYRAGSYTMSAYFGDILNEGFDSPFFYGQTTFDLVDSQTTQVNLECSLYNTMLEVGYDQSVSEMFDDFALLIHPVAGAYLRYPVGEHRPMFLRPGNIDISIAATDHQGRRAIFRATKISNAQQGYYYHIQVSAETTEAGLPQVRLSFSEKIVTDDICLTISSDLFEAASPEIECQGFTPGSTIMVPEGATPAEPIVAIAKSRSLSSVVATFQAMDLFQAVDIPAEINLLDLSPKEESLLEQYGIKMEQTDSTLAVDFTDMIRYVRNRPDNSKVACTLVATDVRGLMSEPTTFDVLPERNTITVVEAPPVVAGIDHTEITLAAEYPLLAYNLVIEQKLDNGKWATVERVTLAENQQGYWVVSIPVDIESTANIPIRILYCGSVYSEIELVRISPSYAVEVDAFALKALVHIIPFDPEMLEYITSHATVYVDNRRATVLRRDPSTGDIVVAGLEQDTGYDVRLSVFDHPAEGDFSETIHVVTERTASLPNSDLEDFEKAIHFKDMLSGGRYSQNYVEIFNQQNLTSFKLDAPKGWANTNAKTFASGAKNHNTWYMQPSCHTITDAVSGSYACLLTTVAFDPDGEPIPDYLQESQPFVPYSRNVPNIAYRAVGKLFLGSYSFDAANVSETYNEGVRMTSRPAALNGFYKYEPGESMHNDRGLARIEILGVVGGVEQVIARAEAHLAPASSYTAFSVPLTYDYFGVKAVSIRVMLASSVNIGSIDEETATNTTTTYLQPANSTGSQLWIDGLSLSY